MMVEIDAPTAELTRQIESAIPNDAPFDLVMASLELALAKRIVTQPAHPAMLGYAAVLVGSHVNALLQHPDVLA